MEAIILAGGKAERLGDAAAGRPKSLVPVGGKPLLAWQIGSGGAEFETPAEGLAGGRGEATVRRGTTQRPWVLIGLP